MPPTPEEEKPDNRALFEAATALDRLEAAWHKVRLNGGAAGGDGVTVLRFGETAPARLIRLQRGLRDGTYCPGLVRRVDIPKPDGGVRPLAIPCVTDRVAQTAAALTLGPLLDPEFSEDSFGYRPGRGVDDAVARVKRCRDDGYLWVVDGDIRRYFENVPHAPLLERVTAAAGNGPLTELVALWLETGAEDGVGLPQGSPLSPLLANLYLDGVDDAIAGRGVRLVRFADDFLLLVRDRDKAEQAMTRIADILGKHGLALNPEKSRIVSFDQGFRFLGHLFVRSLVLPSPNRLLEPDLDDDLRRLAGIDAATDKARAKAEATAAAERAAGLDPGLRVLYVLEPGRRLNLRNQAFTVEERLPDGPAAGWRELVAIPHQRVDRIELGAAAEAPLPALRHALGTDTPLAFVNGHGETEGTLHPPVTRHARRQLAQAAVVLDPERRADLARRIVDGRVRNQRALLRRLNRERKDRAVIDALLALNRVIAKLPLAADGPALMGHEGEAAARFWRALARMLAPEWCFDGTRRRRPAPDPINAVLNLLCGLLERDLSVLAMRHGLHPGFGALHAAEDGAEACVYDLMEEFRAALTEGLTVYMANNRMIAPAGFGHGPGTLCRILPDTAKTVIRTWEAWLDRPVKSPRSGVRVTWRRLMEEQVVAYAVHCEGGEAYKAYVMDY